VTDWESMKKTMNAEQFRLQATTHDIWIHQAKLLMHAANRLYQDRNMALNQMMAREIEDETPEDIWDIQLLPIAQLLAGYAIENLMKGILFSQTPLTNGGKKGGKLNKDIANHDLPNLYEMVCEKTGLNAIPETREFLEGLKKIVIWEGRFPIPKTEKDYVDQKYSWHPGLQGLEMARELFDRLMVEVGKMSNQ